MTKPFDLTQYSITVTVDENPPAFAETEDLPSGSEEEEEEEDESFSRRRSRLVIISQGLCDEIGDSSGGSTHIVSSVQNPPDVDDRTTHLDIPIKILDSPAKLKPAAKTKIADIGRRFGEISIPQNDSHNRAQQVNEQKSTKNGEHELKKKDLKREVAAERRQLAAEHKLLISNNDGISKNSSFITVGIDNDESEPNSRKASFSPSLIGLNDPIEVSQITADLRMGGVSASSEVSSYYDPSKVIKVPLRPVGRMPKRDLPKADVFSRWIFHHLYAHRNEQPTRVAVIEEVNESRCLTYAELVTNVLKAANFLSHHKVCNEMRVALCMENSIEFLTFQLALIAIGATPILLSPGHVASDKIESFDCEAMIVDHSHYGHILRSYEVFGTLEHVFILTDDLTSIYVPRHVWIYDAYGYVDFSPEFRKMLPVEDSHVIAFSTSGSTRVRSRIAAHKSQSAQLLCISYYDKIFDLLLEKDPDFTAINGMHLITGGMHTVEAWSYIMHVLAKGETCIITEATYDVWRASFLDRMAQLIEQYKVALLFTNVQLLRCFLKYGAEKIYNLSSLKIIANTGSPLPEYIAAKIRETLNATVTQGYCSAEHGIVSFDEYKERNQHIVSSGYPFSTMQIKIADIERENELPSSEWGRAMLQGEQMFDAYLSKNHSTKCDFARNWYKTDDYAKIENDGRLYVAGHIQSLIRAEGQTIAPDIIESLLFTHPAVEDCVVSEQNGTLWAGLVVRDEQPLPTADELNKILKKSKNITVSLSKVIQLDFIPRSELGKILRSEVSFVLQNGEQIIDIEGIP